MVSQFEQLNYDFHALGRIHFTGFVCLMQLLLKDGMLEEVVRLFLVGIGKNAVSFRNLLKVFLTFFLLISRVRMPTAAVAVAT